MVRGFRRGREVLLGVAALLAACQPAVEHLETTPIAAGESPIRFRHPDYLPELADHAAHRDAGTGDESHFGRFYGPESRAVVVVLRAGPDRAYPAPSPAIQTPLLLPDAGLLWGASGNATSAFGAAGYRFFEIEGVPLSCLAFTQSRSAPDDRSRRHAELLYGYFCRDELRPLSAEDAGALLAGVDVAWPGHDAPEPDPAARASSLAPERAAEIHPASMSDGALCEAAHQAPLRADLGEAIERRGLACHPAQLACAGIAEPGPCILAMMAQLAHDTAFDCYLGPAPELPPHRTARAVPDRLRAGFVTRFNRLFVEPRVQEPVDVHVYELDPKVVDAGWSPYVATFWRFCRRGFLPLSADDYRRLMGETATGQGGLARRRHQGRSRGTEPAAGHQRAERAGGAGRSASFGSAKRSGLG